MKHTTFFVFIVFFFGLFFISSCEDSLDNEVTTQSFEIARSGGWSPPAAIENRARSFKVTNVQAGTWNGTSSCSPTRTYTPAMASLRQFINSNFPQVTKTGGYNCRKISGTNLTSVHATGRALDIHIPTHNGEADNDKGDPVANYLLENAQRLGIQAIIWDRAIWWSSSAGTGVGSYAGAHPHHDHIHVELTPAAPITNFANENATAAPVPVPAVVSSAGCTNKIVAAGGLIDDKDPCFETFGNQRFWRNESSGLGGTLKWTNATRSSTAKNWARWNLNFDKAGRYRVFYYSTKAYAKFNSTKYNVKGAAGTTEIIVDQSAAPDDEWIELGTFNFAKGKNQYVTVGDNSDGPVASGQRIVADAIGLLPAVGNNTTTTSSNGMKVTLEWSTGTNLDIRVRTPTGNIVANEGTRTRTVDGGRLTSAGCTNGCNNISAATPYREVVEFAAGTELNGNYTVWAFNRGGKNSAVVRFAFTHPDGRIEKRTGWVSSRRDANSQQFSFNVRK